MVKITVIRFCKLTLTIILITLVSVNEITGDSKTDSWFDDRRDVPPGLIIPYIKDKEIRAQAWAINWCGTPILQYLAKFPEPPESVLEKLAEDMETGYR